MVIVADSTQLDHGHIKHLAAFVSFPTAKNQLVISANQTTRCSTESDNATVVQMRS